METWDPDAIGVTAFVLEVVGFGLAAIDLYVPPVRGFLLRRIDVHVEKSTSPSALLERMVRVLLAGFFGVVWLLLAAVALQYLDSIQAFSRILYFLLIATFAVSGVLLLIVAVVRLLSIVPVVGGSVFRVLQWWAGREHGLAVVGLLLAAGGIALQLEGTADSFSRLVNRGGGTGE